MAKKKPSHISDFLNTKIPILDDVIYYIPENANTLRDYNEQKSIEQKAEVLKQLSNSQDKDLETENKINEFKDIGFDDIEIEARNNDYDEYFDSDSSDYSEFEETTEFLDSFDEEVIEEPINSRFMDSSAFLEIIDTNQKTKDNFIIESLDDENEITPKETFFNNTEDELTNSLFDNNSFVINDLESLEDSNDGLESFDFDSINGAKKPLLQVEKDDDEDLLDDNLKYIKKVNNLNNISSEDKDDYSSFMLKMKIREDKK